MKSFFCLAIVGLILLSCHKEKHGETVCFDGVVKWEGAPAADGLGWVIHQDDSVSVYRPYIPQNLPDDFKVNNLKVAVCLYQTDEKFYCFCATPLNKYRITSLQRR